MMSIIAEVPLFRTLSSKQIEKLISISIVEKYEDEAILYYEKERSSRLLVLVDGLAKAYKIDKYDNEIILYFIEKGDMISQITDLFTDKPTFYSNISVLEASTILSIDYPSFLKHFVYNNILTVPFANEIILQSNKMRTVIDREFIYNAVSKVAMMLIEDLEMFNKLKRHDIALILHIQPATLSRVLMKLKKSGMIEINHGKVFVKDKEKLEAIYGE